jgi:hypothetical protein
MTGLALNLSDAVIITDASGTVKHPLKNFFKRVPDFLFSDFSLLIFPERDV